MRYNDLASFILSCMVVFIACLSFCFYVFFGASIASISIHKTYDFFVILKVTSVLSVPYFPYLIVFSILWLLFVRYNGHNIILYYADVRKVINKIPSEKDICELVEKSAKKVGIESPQVYVIQDSFSVMNAFSIGYRPNKTAIVFTIGLLKTLSQEEIEIVIIRELLQIKNKDTKLDLMLIVGVGFFEFAAKFFSPSNLPLKAKNNPLAAVFSLAFGIFAVLIYPIKKIALIKEREYEIDEMTAIFLKKPKELASILSKISKNPYVNKLQAYYLIAISCICFPFDLQKTNVGHPAIENRIARLNKMNIS